MKGLVWVILLALTAIAQFAVYSPEYYRDGLYLVAEFRRESFVWYDDYVEGGLYASLPGVVASAWLPNGTTLEYVYKKAMALFDVPQIDPKRAVKWKLWLFHKQFGEYILILRASVSYGLHVAVKIGNGPVVKAVKVAENVQFGATRINAWNATDPCPECAEVVIIGASYNFLYNGTNLFCIRYFRFKQEWWYQSKNYAYSWKWEGYEKQTCWPSDPPRNITAVALKDRVEIWADGRLVYTYPTEGEPWLYTGPYRLLFYSTTAMAFISTTYPAEALQPLGRAWLFIGNDTIAPPKYASSHGRNAAAAYDPANDLQAAVSFDGVGASVGPGLTRETKVVVNPEVEVAVFGRRLAVVRGAFLKCPAGEPVVRGALEPFWDGFLAMGPGSLSCTKYPVAVRTAAGVRVVVADANSTLVWRPPPDVVNGTRYWYKPVSAYVGGPMEVSAEVERVEYRVAVEYPWGVEEVWAYGRLELPAKFVELDNGTAYEAGPLSLYVDKPTAVRPNYTVYYAVVFKTPLGANKTWAKAGSLVEAEERFVDFGNGTALFLKPARARVRWPGGGVEGTFQKFYAYGPAEVEYSGARLYAVALVTPLGANTTWVREGGRFVYTPPPLLDLGNGTALRSPNGTCHFAVTRPARCVVTYRERLYRLRIATPVNTTELWLPAGSAYKAPAIFELGNLTRLVDPQPAAVAADKPMNVTVSYRRQYWVEVRGVSEWRGWAYEGAEIPLNETEIGGVRYVPVERFIEVRAPLNATPRYTAVFGFTARDALGVPDPTAWAYLCGRRFDADALGRIYAEVETDKTCDVTIVRQWPISPYTLAALAGIAAAATAFLLKRKKALLSSLFNISGSVCCVYERDNHVPSGADIRGICGSGCADSSVCKLPAGEALRRADAVRLFQEHV